MGASGGQLKIMHLMRQKLDNCSAAFLSIARGLQGYVFYAGMEKRDPITLCL